MANRLSSLLAGVVLLTSTALLQPFAQAQAAARQANCQTFGETGKAVCGRFLEYWQTNGGLPQQGFPITEEMQEWSETDGKTYTMQYFERAVFELHPENRPPYDVLLSLLGVFEYKRYYSLVGPANQRASADNPRFFSQTGKTIGGRFREYWEQNGGLAQQGYPITDEFEEKSRLNGKTYTVQYFERAVFELHPENQAPYDVLLSHLGTFRSRYKNYKPGPGDCSRLYTLRGEVVGQGTNTTPIGYGMKSYQLEEVVLPGPITCQVYVPSPAGGYHTPTLTFDKFWRLTLNADRIFHVGESRWDIFLNGTLAGWGMPTSKHEITALIYDSARLLEGATIGFSYGDPINPEYTLPENLNLRR